MCVRHNRAHRRRLAVMVVLLALSLSLAGCGAETDTWEARASDASSPDRQPVAAGSQPTEVAEVEALSRTIQVAGRLRPRVRIVHALPVPGVINTVLVNSGDRVDTGAPLFTVERDAVGQTFRPVPVPSRVTGVVSEVHIQAEESRNAGEAGVTVVGTDDYILEARVSDKDSANIVVGRPVTAYTANGRAVEGILESRSPEPDYETGLFTLRLRFPGSAGISIGTFLSVELPIRRISGVFVPRSAIDRRYGRYFVWVVEPGEQVLQRREVSLGEVIGEATRIEGGLAPGERYLVSLSGREREGAPAPAHQDG